MKKILWILLIVYVVATGYWTIYRDNWPKPTGAQYSDEARLVADKYMAEKIDANTRIQKYSTSGDFLRYGTTKSFRETDRLILDHSGIPMLIAHGKKYYEPTTVSQYALHLYGRAILDKNFKEFLESVDKLIHLQRQDGAFVSPYPFRHYSNKKSYSSPWISGMAQGNALSALARAYIITNDERYLRSGEAALAFLNVGKEKGGPRTTLKDLDPSLQRYHFYLEYVTAPDVYTLNGYMFTLMGLYDWWQATGSRNARREFKKGIWLLEKMLPYYDLNTLSAYDLSFMTHKDPWWRKSAGPHISAGYHAVHLQQLYALNSVYPRKILSTFYEKWTTYISK